MAAKSNEIFNIFQDFKKEIDLEEDTSNFQLSSTENQDLPCSDNVQNLMEWLYNKKLKDHFSMDDIVSSPQYIIDCGGAKVFNTVNLCEDAIGRVFKTASASRSLPEEEDKKEASFEESDKEEEEEEEEEEEWVGENDEEDDYEMTSRCLNRPHLSNFVSIDKQYCGRWHDEEVCKK
jgi:hypothetical protein